MISPYARKSRFRPHRKLLRRLIVSTLAFCHMVLVFIRSFAALFFGSTHFSGNLYQSFIMLFNASWMKTNICLAKYCTAKQLVVRELEIWYLLASRILCEIRALKLLSIMARSKQMLVLRRPCFHHEAAVNTKFNVWQRNSQLWAHQIYRLNGNIFDKIVSHGVPSRKDFHCCSSSQPYLCRFILLSGRTFDFSIIVFHELSFH